MILKLINNENTYEFNVTDLNEGVKLYYHFEIPTVDIPDGKYNMQLLDGETVIYEDIVCIGDFKGATIQYKRGENIYINAPIDGKFEDVTVEITATQTTVYPNDGFDGMTSVVIDATPVYDDGFNSGSVDGYNTGKQDGIEIGYNSGYTDGETTGYNNGYQAGIDYVTDNANEIAAANAIVLVATEFRTYYTKFSDNIVNPNPVTGIYPDGETFHNLAEVKNIVYNTGIIPNETTKLEFWFVPDLIKDEQDGDWYSIVIDAEKTDTNSFRIRHYHPAGDSLRYEFQISNNRIQATLKNGINHIEMSYADGLIVNGEKVGDFTSNINNEFDQPFYINGTPQHTPPTRTDDGEFGIIKITTNGTTNVIIPIEDGLKNITTDEMLEVVYNGGTYKYINNDPIVLDNLIKSVNVQPKIDVAEYGLKFTYSTFKELPEIFDFSKVADMSHMFESCVIQTIPKINTSNANNMDSMFRYCYSLTSIPEIDTSNVTNMTNMFYYCRLLTSIPEIDTSNVTVMSDTFSNCTALTSLPALNMQSLNMYSFYGVFGNADLPNLINFGGFLNLKMSLADDKNLKKLPNLTYESCINVLNGLYDFTGNGETPTSSQGQLKVHPNFLTTVGNEISIGTSKGWTITA